MSKRSKNRTARPPFDAEAERERVRRAAWASTGFPEPPFERDDSVCVFRDTPAYEARLRHWMREERHRVRDLLVRRKLDAVMVEIDRRVASDRKAREKATKKAVGTDYGDVAAFQEQHSPTVPYTIRGDVRHDPISGVPKRQEERRAHRRTHDPLPYMDLTPDQWQAAEDMRDKYAAAYGASGIVVANYECRVDSGGGGGSSAAHRGFDQKVDFAEWQRRCEHHGVDHEVCTKVVQHIVPCAQLDAGRRKGWAADQVREGLDIWYRFMM